MARPARARALGLDDEPAHDDLVELRELLPRVARRQAERARRRGRLVGGRAARAAADRLRVPLRRAGDAQSELALRRLRRAVRQTVDRARRDPQGRLRPRARGRARPVAAASGSTAPTGRSAGSSGCRGRAGPARDRSASTSPTQRRRSARCSATARSAGLSFGYAARDSRTDGAAANCPTSTRRGQPRHPPDAARRAGPLRRPGFHAVHGAGARRGLRRFDLPRPPLARPL